MTSVFADMHTHTTCSDGALAPAELVHKANDCGIRVLAITDHDTIDAIAPAMIAATDTDVEIVPGVELSIHFRGRELHLLGFCFDWEDAGLRQFLDQYQVFRAERAQAIVDRLNDLGINLRMSDVHEVARGGAIGRPHIARALVGRGFVDTIGQAFLRFLRNGGPADVQKQLPSAEDAIKTLHTAGGIAVLAHPGNWVSDRDLSLLKTHGMDGVEIIHPSHDETLTIFYTDVAHRLNLLTTGGSDFHGLKPGDDKNFGVVGFSEEQYQSFQQVCKARFAA